MTDLNHRESELVALGAALGSNCVPCIEYHVPRAREAGLTDQEIYAAIRLADKVRQVPARKVLETALNLLPHVAGESSDTGQSSDCGCDNPGINSDPETETSKAADTLDNMATMMSKMMASCCPVTSSSGDESASVKKTDIRTASGGCGG